MLFFRHIVVGTLLLVWMLSSCSHKRATNIHINWSDDVCEVPRQLWSVNDYELISPNNVVDAGFQQFGRELSPSIVRVHQALIADSFTLASTRQWDTLRISYCFREAMKAFPGASFMINPICIWPYWLAHPDSVLSTEQENELVALFASFTEFATEEKLPLHSIEIFNEREHIYSGKNRISDLWRLFNRISDTIRFINPEIRIAGPALTWPRKDWTEGFLSVSGTKTDYFTWHGYYSGTPETPNCKVVNKGITHIDSLAGYVNQAINQYGLTNLVSCLTEYNVQWTWEPFEIRHANNIGAVYQALIIRSMAMRNLHAAMVWHVKGFSYGLINDQNTLRSTGQLYLWGNHYLSGTMVASKTSDPEIVVFPVRQTSKTRSVLLINKAPAEKIISDIEMACGFIPTRIEQLTESKFEAVQVDAGSTKILLPAYSLTLIIETDN